MVLLRPSPPLWLATLPLAAMSSHAPLLLLTRKPKRVTITVSHTVLDRLHRYSDQQGRSTSNLAAYLLEVALDAMENRPPIEKRWPKPAT